MFLEYWHPTIISYSDNLFHNEIEKTLLDYCLELQEKKEKGGYNWISKSLYNTHHTYDISKDEKFKLLNDWILNEANEYCKKIESEDTLNFQNGWFNIYKKNDFQEFHTHPGSSISGIYFLKSDAINDARTIFETYTTENFLDLKAPSNDRLVYYKPKPGRLLLFKSTLRHCVEQQKSDNMRITLAYNFLKKKVD
jgi:uncharacterized protein (TIGR02466 family)